MEEGVLKTGLKEWARYCQLETSQGEVCQAEGQLDRDTEAGKSAVGLAVGSCYDVRLESKRRGWSGRSEPAPEEAPWHGSDNQEGATDGSRARD